MFKFNLKSMFLAAVFGMLTTPALAQEVPEHGVYILNTLLFLMAGFLVMFMAAGFCMLEAGLVRSGLTRRIHISVPSSPLERAALGRGAAPRRWTRASRFSRTIRPLTIVGRPTLR